MGDDIGIPFLASPLPEYKFVNADMLKKSNQFAVGLQYSLKNIGKFRQYIGLGYGFENVMPYQIFYDFRNEDLELERTDTLNLRWVGPMPQFLLFRAGVERSIAKHWHWGFQASYRSSLTSLGLQSPDIFNFSTGLRYHF